MIGLLGKKIGMTNIFDESGRNIPVTLVEAGPCYILQIKTMENDGYNALQIGFGAKREKLVNKPDKARFKKAGVDAVRFVKELRVNDVAPYKLGQKIEVDVFAKGDYVDVVGTSIGKGFQGGVRRWNWKGGPGGHGSMFHRAVGSIQSGARLGRVTKGHHLPGHMGVDRITIQNLEVLDVDKENSLIIIRGSVPGHKNNFLVVKEARKRPKGFVKAKAVQVSSKKSVKATVGKKK
ncbi:MAG: 50S ribosomal protein L3 [Candidatus Omnitrophota bacterium]|nr:50S ribosomal protein L3 [Candidatus Omnitrophota bacterium]